MGDKEVIEIKNLENESLIDLFHLVEKHLQYLDENIIEISEEGGDVSNE